MNSNVEEIRNLMLQLLADTRRETRSMVSGVDPELVVFDDHPAWRVRDVVGHLGVWNGEAARSLRAHTDRNEYYCIASEAKYDEYNAAAVEERRAWGMDQVWAEYESSCSELRMPVATMGAGTWNSEMLYPWNERGAVRNLIEVMMRHEVEHRERIIKAG